MIRPPFALAFAVLLAASGCFRPVRETVEVRVPQLRSEEGIRRVTAAFQGLPADLIQGLEFDLERRVVRVTYDNQRLRVRNIEHLIADAGFDANETPADAAQRARLPEECR
jgi:hypothetical protein